ncbi:hypothetical protein DUNSADRAFT_13318, partial [Dunaliella salina]
HTAAAVAAAPDGGVAGEAAPPGGAAPAPAPAARAPAAPAAAAARAAPGGVDAAARNQSDEFLSLSHTEALHLDHQQHSWQMLRRSVKRERVLSDEPEEPPMQSESVNTPENQDTKRRAREYLAAHGVNPADVSRGPSAGAPPSPGGEATATALGNLPPTPTPNATTTAGASPFELLQGRTFVCMHQQMSRMEQYMNEQWSRLHHQFCAGISLCNRYVENQRQGLADAGIPAPAPTPNPDPPPGTSSHPLPDSSLPQKWQPELHKRSAEQVAELWDYVEANSDVVVRNFAQEVDAERLRALLSHTSSPFCSRLAHWHDSLTKLHCATNKHAVEAVEEVQARAVSAKEEEEQEMRDALMDYTHATSDSAWDSSLVACTNIGCKNLTRRKSSHLKVPTGVKCSICGVAVFCSYQCQLSAMSGAQAHCGHVLRMSTQKASKAAAGSAKSDPSKARQGGH